MTKQKWANSHTLRIQNMLLSIYLEGRITDKEFDDIMEEVNELEKLSETEKQ